jgi:ABC-type amino acid transport substrate-binding protein
VLGIYVRADDHRFDNGVAAINDPAIKIAVIDGGMADKIATSDFPKAVKFSIPELSDYSALLMNVVTGKADVSISASHEAHGFLQANPGTLREVKTDFPIRVLPNTIFFAKGEFELASMINSALDEIYYKGQLEKIIAQYEPFPGAFYRVAAPYQLPQN